MKAFRYCIVRYFVVSASLLLVLILESHTVVYADDHISVYTEEFYPLSYANQNGISGYATELATAVLDEAGISYDINLVPWVRVIRALDGDANVLAFSMFRTKDRETKYHWVGEVIPLNYSLYGLKRKLNLLPKTLELARDTKIGVNRGDVAQSYLSSLGFSNLILVKDDERSLYMLARNRIDLFPYAEIVINAFVEHHGFEPDDFFAVLKLQEISTSAYMALSQKTDPKMVSRMQEAYKNVKMNGTYDRIMKQLVSGIEKNNTGMDSKK